MQNYVLDKSILSDQEKEKILMALQGLIATEDKKTDELLLKLGGLFQSKILNWIEVDFSDWVSKALERVKVKKPNQLYDEIFFATENAGLCVEILHIGAYDDEPASFDKMDGFAKENGLERTGNCHREVYLNNANRIEKSKLKTILRYSVLNN